MQERIRSSSSRLLVHGNSPTRFVPTSPAALLRHRWQALAVALLAGLVVLLGAPGGPAQAAPCSGSSLDIVAHPDDDLLFLSPDVLHDLQSSRCVTTVYVTAGDDGQPDSFWQGREDGVKAAYAQMAGVADAWTQVPSIPLTEFTLDAAPRVTLVFMRLPDGNANGAGFATHSNQSLQKLWQSSIGSIDAVDGSASYTKQGLTDALAGLMNAFQPDLIRTQDSVVGFGSSDHSDHYASALFADAAQSAYSTSHTTASYIDYEVANYPQNVFGTDLTAKQNAFYTYGAHDSHTCHSDATCLTRPERDWLTRSYLVGTPNANAGGDQTIQTIGSTVHLNGSASTDPGGHALTYSWQQVGGAPSVTLAGASTATPSFTAPAASTILTFALTAGNGSLESTDTITVTIAPNSTNIAGLAIATSSTAAAGQSASSAIDGFTDGYPLGNATHEWSTDHERAGAWLQLTWPAGRTIDRIVLYDRPNSNDQITSGTLTFSDGSTVDVPSLANNGFAAAISFPAVSTTSVRLTITSVSDSTTNIGLAEIEAWTPADHAPVADAGSNQTVDAASTVTLDGSASSDPDAGDTLTYAWTQTGGTAVTLSSATAKKPTFTAPADSASLRFELTVSDGTLTNSDSVTIDVSPVSDLQIMKTDSVSDVNAGSTVTYTIDVSNAGPSTATNLTVSDPLPAGTSFVSATGTGWACGEAAGTVSCTRASLAVGPAPAIELVLTAPDEGGTLANTATVSATEVDPTPGNNSATDTDSVTPVANLAISKTDGVAKIDENATAGYTIVVSNAGPSDASGAVFKDAAVANLSVSGVSCDSVAGGAACPSGPATTVALMQDTGIVIPTLPSGGSVSFTVTGTAGTGAEIVNTATLDPPSGTLDPASANNTATDTDVVNHAPAASAGSNQTADAASTVTLDGSASSDPDAGDTLTYAWTQTGGATVSLSDSTAAKPTFTAPAEATTLTFELTVSDGTLSDTSSVEVVVTPVADLQVEKTDGVSSVNAGSSTSYTIRVTNAGPSSATAATLTDAVATGLAKNTVECSTSPGQCSSSTTPTVSELQSGYGLPALASGQHYELTVTASVTATHDSVANTAAVTAPVGTVDPTPGNNSATDTDSVTPVANLAISKTDGVAKIDENATAGYTIVVSNAGPSDASGAVFKDAAAANLSVSGVSCDSVAGGAACPSGPATTVALMQDTGIVIPTLPSGGSVSFTVTGTAGTGAEIVNTATLDPPSGTLDPASANNTATDTDVVNHAPAASAGPDQGVNKAAPVTLDGSASSDPDGDTLTYAWTQTGGATVSLSDSTAAKPTFTAPNSESALTFELTVSDGRLTSSDSVTIGVADRAPAADAGPNQSVNTGTSVTLDGSASSDPDGDTLTYAWTQTGGTAVSFSSATAKKPTFTAPSRATSLTFELTVSDGVLTSSDTVTITVPDRAPVAAAGPDQNVNRGASVTLDGSASSDPDAGDTLSYAWTQTSGTPVTLSSATVKKPTFTAPAGAGALSFELTVSDGVLTGSDSVTVAVGDRAPVASAGPDQIVNVSSSVQLDGSASIDPDHDALSYKWEQTGGSPVALSSATAAKPTFTTPAGAGTLDFKLTVSDGTLTSSDTVQITVLGKATPVVKGYKLPQTKLVRMKIRRATHTAMFRFSGSGGEGKLTLECRIDKHRFSNCHGSRVFRHLKRGGHVFRVRARDSYGLADQTIVTKRFKI